VASCVTGGIDACDANERNCSEHPRFHNGVECVFASVARLASWLIGRRNAIMEGREVRLYPGDHEDHE
jgi:hypothetical protein